MNTTELLKRFLQVPELSTLGSPEERAAFIALRINNLTVREAGHAIGISKSSVQNLAVRFQTKLRKKIVEMEKKRRSLWSGEYARLHEDLLEQLPEDDDYGGHKIGDFEPDNLSREDLAEAFGRGAPRFEDE